MTFTLKTYFISNAMIGTGHLQTKLVYKCNKFRPYGYEYDGRAQTIFWMFNNPDNLTHCDRSAYYREFFGRKDRHVPSFTDSIENFTDYRYVRHDH